MARSKFVLCVAVGLSSLTANSTVAFAAGLKPAIFDGAIYFILLGASAVCWAIYRSKAREDRREQVARAERIHNFSAAVHYADGDRPSASGWRPKPSR